MKAILLSDLHLLADKPKARMDDAPQVQFYKLEWALDFSYKAFKADVVLQAGDFSDTPRSWRLLSFYSRFLRGIRQKVYTVFGQHDTYMYNETARDKTTLGVMAENDLVTVLNATPHKVGNAYIYGASYGEPVPEVPDAKPPAGMINILVVHRMIVDNQLWSGQENYSHAKVFLRTHKRFELILCGDAHQRFLVREGDRIICNTGPLLRREASLDMTAHKPGFYLYDTETKEIDWHEIPHAPAEEVLDRRHIENAQQANAVMDRFIAEVKKSMATSDSEKLTYRDRLINFMRSEAVSAPVVKIIEDVMNDAS